jgi:3-hydroxyacyl-CoA dehydrogenase/enoyl-CoA hydratase/3-hydroxybutyryl-CoA epimerase
MGLVDKVVEPAMLTDAAIDLARRGTRRPLKQRALAWLTDTWAARQILAPMLVKQVARKVRKEHYPAPFSLIETWRRTGGGVESLLAAERKSVTKLASTPTARNLVRVFFLQERLKGLGGKDHGIARVHVVGAGVMGGDIAAWAAVQGLRGDAGRPRTALRRCRARACAGPLRKTHQGSRKNAPPPRPACAATCCTMA